MVLGIGIDTVCISELEGLCADDGGVFERYAFTDAERAFASGRARRYESLAGIYAVKEAVTKAVCTLRPSEWIDLRRIGVGHDEHGAPFVEMTSPLREYLELAGVGSLLVSITNEGDFATAIALAQDEA